MSKFFFNEMVLPAGIIALLLVACGDSATAPAGEKNADGNVADFGPVDNLPSCTENCEGNQWNPVQEWPSAPVSSATQSYSPSEMPKSSSSAESNSSSVKLSSSTVVKFSSSSVRFSSSSVAKSSSSSVKSSSSKGSSASSSLIEYGTLIDSRDGHRYKTVTIVSQEWTIGSQVWMAQNLNYVPNNLYCYDNDKSNCSKYGALYTWAQAMDSVGTWSSYGAGCGDHKRCTPTYPVRGVCPEGWHLPTQYEWNALFTSVGGSSIAGTKLKSQSGWNDNGNGDDAFGFSALPAGAKHPFIDGNGVYFYNEGDAAYFWTSVEYSEPHYAYAVTLAHSQGANIGYNPKDYRFSVRCLQDYSESWP